MLPWAAVCELGLTEGEGEGTGCFPLSSSPSLSPHHQLGLFQAGLICKAALDTAETNIGLLGQVPLISQTKEPDWSQHISQPPGNR